MHKKEGYQETRKILLLCVFLGWLGVHRFYCGWKKSGFLYLFTFGFIGIGVIIDLLRIAFDNFRYCYSYIFFSNSLWHSSHRLNEATSEDKIICWIGAICYSILLIYNREIIPSLIPIILYITICLYLIYVFIRWIYRTFIM